MYRGLPTSRDQSLGSFTIPEVFRLPTWPATLFAMVVPA